ncbi:MAG: hypothetical protein NZO16_03885 [Deltaproteobacteria bacterium]|nr:hypothetical protein [Deltaproteobacteria bacterium]
MDEGTLVIADKAYDSQDSQKMLRSTSLGDGSRKQNLEMIARRAQGTIGYRLRSVLLR